MKMKENSIRSICGPGKGLCGEEADRCVRLAEYLIENQTTVRATAGYFGISKSTVHKDIAEKLPHVNTALYEAARRILALNKAQRHIRGGQATKTKYQKIRERRQAMSRGAH